MRKPHIPRWSDPAATTHLLLIAQRVDEALFDYTLDSYKVPALNTRSRCFELQHTLGEVRNGRMPEKTLVPLYEELAASIGLDTAVQALLGPSHFELREVSNWTKISFKDALAQVEMILTALRGRRYEDELLRQLSLAVDTSAPAEGLLLLLDNLLVEWQTTGFSKDFIFHRSRAFFFTRAGPLIDSHTALSEYTRFFRRKPTEWTVIFRASADLAELGDHLPPSAAQIHREAPPARSQRSEEQAFFSAPHAGVYVQLTIPAVRDARAAWESADALLAFLVNIARAHSHRGKFEWEPQAVVYDAKNFPRILGSPASAILKQKDVASHQLADSFGSTLGVVLRLNAPMEPFSQFQSALSLHTAALTTKSIDTQLFSLWAALESLLPLDGAPSRIERTCEFMRPVLSRRYPQKLIAELHNSFLDNIANEYNNALQHINGQPDPLHACGLLICMEQYAPLRASLYSACESNPLLAHRLQVLQRSFKNSELIRKTIEAHERRVNWHLRRIYRNRNIIAHRGERLPYRAALVENLHAYFDTLLTALVDVFASEDQPRSIHAALMTIRHEYRAHLGVLDRSKRAELTPDNCIELLFGPT